MLRSGWSRLPLLLSAILSVPVGAAAPAAPARAAGDPLFLGWTSTLPPTVEIYNPSSEDDCTAGRPQCVDRTIRRMERRLDELADRCHHNAVFALAYLRTTEMFREVAEEPGYFADVRFVNHENAVFAEYYFVAYDDWAGGRRADVPEAWRIAFDNAGERRVSGSGNLLLGMNAHVNRDLPFALASVGIAAADGTSRKPDHDKVNEFLNRVVDPLLVELARRFDPTIDDTRTPYGLSYTVFMQLLLSWREEAWRNAERLVAAADPHSRAQVAREIEDGAAATAQAIAGANGYAPPVTDSTSRDLFCAAQRDA